jgi:hypothetical protein
VGRREVGGSGLDSIQKSGSLSRHSSWASATISWRLPNQRSRLIKRSIFLALQSCGILALLAHAVKKPLVLSCALSAGHDSKAGGV